MRTNWKPLPSKRLIVLCSFVPIRIDLPSTSQDRKQESRKQESFSLENSSDHPTKQKQDSLTTENNNLIPTNAKEQNG